MDKEEPVSPHVEEYFELLEGVARWCKGRASMGDVSVAALAHKFADNVISQADSQTH